ncbi:hypothetical protein LSH36_2660g00000 [Paralvinella palmiformis]|uniref:Uncharacterized protein n=1 Tax=Paralvinella palmiformis TaxID=53620 RepID=A0AAD9IQG8_9ANNE|nr:hypothetical protein LSH36_2660g00000 [Paralvinella palmiformis]
MDYEVQDPLLKGLVKLLRPAKEDLLNRPDILDDPDVPRMSAPLPVFVQQAAAAKTIGIYAEHIQLWMNMFMKLWEMHCMIHSWCVYFSNPEALYTVMNAVQADVLVSNKVNIPGIAED